MLFPLMKISGPIEASLNYDCYIVELIQFPLMKISGPIEATVAWKDVSF